MPTFYMKLPHEVKVLKPDALRPLVLEKGPVGFTLDVGLNYYRGLHLSTIEELAIAIDGTPIPSEALLLEYDNKLFMPDQIGLACTDFWSVKKDLRIRAYQGGLAPGRHAVELTLHLRCPYMQFAPGVWGAIDGSATRELELQESK